MSEDIKKMRQEKGSVHRENDSKYKMVRLILRSVAINRNNIREVSLCKWLLRLPEMYPVIICIFAANYKDLLQISRISSGE